MRPLLLALVLAGSALSLGCRTTPGSTTPNRLDHDDLPRCYERARAIEEEAIRHIHNGNATKDRRKRREFYDIAMNRLREARLLYEEELLGDPGTPERERNLEREIQRISDRIERLHKDRPAG